MIITFQLQNKIYQADLSKPIDISIPLIFNSLDNPNAWYCPQPEAVAQRFDTSSICVEKGAPVNSFGVKIYPHGNGTHTESIGHLLIDNKKNSINTALKTFHTVARLLSLFPIKKENGDRIIAKHQLEEVFENFEENPFNSLIIRTLPNDPFKKKMQWSGSNPPYFEADGLAFLAKKNILHLLTDLPSVDKEDDGGKVAAHRAFWQFSSENTEGVRQNATITEMIYVANNIKDGLFFLNLQIPSFELDAAPSKPTLYKLF
jgi:arylformamidase